jgi:hypothetical protein
MPTIAMGCEPAIFDEELNKGAAIRFAQVAHGANFRNGHILKEWIDLQASFQDGDELRQVERFEAQVVDQVLSRSQARQ